MLPGGAGPWLNPLFAVGIDDRLKYATVKPIFKKGNKQEISNYRPISLLTSPRFLKNLFVLDSLLILRRIVFWYMNNMDLGLIPRLRGLTVHS